MPPRGLLTAKGSTEGVCGKNLEQPGHLPWATSGLASVAGHLTESLPCCGTVVTLLQYLINTCGITIVVQLGTDWYVVAVHSV